MIIKQIFGIGCLGKHRFIHSLPGFSVKIVTVWCCSHSCMITSTATSHSCCGFTTPITSARSNSIKSLYFVANLVLHILSMLLSCGKHRNQTLLPCVAQVMMEAGPLHSRLLHLGAAHMEDLKTHYISNFPELAPGSAFVIRPNARMLLLRKCAPVRAAL